MLANREGKASGIHVQHEYMLTGTGNVVCEWALETPHSPQPAYYHVLQVHMIVHFKTDGSFHGQTIRTAQLPPALNAQCSSALDFLDWTARLICVGSGGRHAATVHIVLPAQDGCIVRADILRQRLATSKSIERKEEFVSLDEVRSMLVKLGFNIGVFHVEARITNSSMAYTSGPDGVDLRPHGKQLPRLPPSHCSKSTSARLAS